MGAKIVVLEEASRLDRQVFEEVVIPLLGVKDTAVLAISTPLDAGNFYSQMLELKQVDGVTPLFNVLRINLICEECAKLDLKDQIACPHKQHEIPPWKSSGRQQLVKTLLESNPEMYKREQLGMVTTKNNSAFPSAGVQTFQQSSLPLPDLERISHVFVAIDPAGGGSSFAAITSAIVYNNRTNVMVRRNIASLSAPVRRILTCS